MNIIIANLDNTVTVTMPRTRNLNSGGRQESKTITTTSGRIVEEMIGFRATITAYWEWVPADTMTALCGLLRTGKIFNVTYPDQQGIITKPCQVIYPSPGVFKYRQGVPIWYGVNLIITAQEVE